MSTQMKSFCALLIGLGCVVSVHAQSNIIINLKPQDPSWTLSTAVLSEYLARPGFSLCDKPVSQNDLSFTWKGMYVGAWSSSGLEKSSQIKYDQELQIYLGYKKLYGWLTFDANIRYDALKEFTQSKDDLWMADFRIDLTKMPIVQPYVATRYFESVGSNDKPDNGWFVWFGIARAQDLGFGLTDAGHLKIIADTSVAYSDGALSRDTGWTYSRFGTKLVVPITKKFSIAPLFIVQFPLDEQGVGRRPYTDGNIKVVGGLMATLKF